MKKLRYNAFIKVAIIGVLILLLLIPAMLIENLVDERQYHRDCAIEEVSDKWSGHQSLTGPFLSIPYHEYNDKKKSVETHYLHVMPENLKVTGNLATQKLHRGIYDVVVYNSDIQISGNFGNMDFAGVPKDAIRFDRAVVCMGITDLRGIEEQLSIHFGDNDYEFEAGLPNSQVKMTGVQTVVNLTDSLIANAPFTLTLKLKGAGGIEFSPVGSSTEVQLSSDWNNPSFTGGFLPSERTVNEQGFSAEWKTMHLNRNFPKSWIDDSYYVGGDSDFGVTLLLPVDGYQKTERCVKYSILFTTITFLIFFFVEISRKKLLHPLHYLLVGAALIVFYTLLLSISEYVSFNLAYLIASLATITLITLYAKAVLKSWSLGMFVGGVLVILYGYMFTILQLQDYALLAGSIFIFVVLCLVMYFSRKVDWYNLNNSEEQSKSEQKTITVKQNTSHDETFEPHHQVSDSLDTDFQ